MEKMISKSNIENKVSNLKVKIFAQSMMILFITLAIIPFSPISVPSVLLKVIIFFAGVISFWYVGYKVPTLKQ